MSLSDSELSITKSFGELLNYISKLGVHINQIYDRLDKIEANISETKEELRNSITDNKNELENIREVMVTKSEFNNLLKKLNEPFEQFSLPQTPKQQREKPTSLQPEQEEQ